MPHLYVRRGALGRGYLLLLGLLATLATHAQAPDWSRAIIGTYGPASSYCSVRAVTTNASGELLVTGVLRGSVGFGSTLLTSVGGYDLFVAKYLPATSTWAWALRAGGTGDDYGTGIAVSGSNVYVTGSLTNNVANSAGMVLDGGPAGTITAAGLGPRLSADLMLFKYIDRGNSAGLEWRQLAGGTSADYGTAVVVSGSSVYVTGSFVNDLANSQLATVGSIGSGPGPFRLPGASASVSTDLLLLKYRDDGASASLSWTQVAGGTELDEGRALAVSGGHVYVTGLLTNDLANNRQVMFGGSGVVPGTQPCPGASSYPSLDLILARFTDGPYVATCDWTQVAGGTGTDAGTAVAVQGSSVYVAGYQSNSLANSYQVLYSGGGPGSYAQPGASPAAGPDVVLAKYQDNGSAAAVVWTQVGGGSGDDYGTGLAVSGSSVYVTGVTANTTANANQVVFGGSGPVTGTVPLPGLSSSGSGYDLLLARYQDNGPTSALAWVRTGGSATANDDAHALLVRGQQVLLAGEVGTPATFGATTVTSPVPGAILGMVAVLTDPALPLPARAASPGPALALYPCPAPGGAARLTGAEPGMGVRVVDALGRVAATAVVGEDGTAVLGGLVSGLYLVRVGAGSVRLAAE